MPNQSKEMELEDSEVVELKPDFSLKNKIGKDVQLRDVFTKESIKESQQVINDSQKDFLKWVENDLKNLENAYSSARADPSASTVSADEIKRGAFSIKAQAGTFGFTLGSAIAKSLYDFCEKDYREAEPGHLIVIRKHIDTLNTIFHQRIEGDGGKIGLAIHKDLGRLIEKYA